MPGIREITEPIDLRIVDDRLHFTCISGEYRQTYSLSFHKARNASMGVGILLDQRDRVDRVVRLEARH